MVLQLSTGVLEPQLWEPRCLPRTTNMIHFLLETDLLREMPTNKSPLTPQNWWGFRKRDGHLGENINVNQGLKTPARDDLGFCQYDALAAWTACYQGTLTPLPHRHMSSSQSELQGGEHHTSRILGTVLCTKQMLSKHLLDKLELQIKREIIKMPEKCWRFQISLIAISLSCPRSHPTSNTHHISQFCDTPS